MEVETDVWQIFRAPSKRSHLTPESRNSIHLLKFSDARTSYRALTFPLSAAHLLAALPSLDEFVLDTKMIQYTRHDCIDGFCDRLGLL